MTQSILNIIIATSSILTAIGTIGACVVALYLSNRNKKRKTFISVHSGYRRNGKIWIARLISPQKIGADLDRGIVIRISNKSELPLKIESIEYEINDHSFFWDNFESIQVPPYRVKKIFIPITKLITTTNITHEVGTIRFLFSLVSFIINTDYDESYFRILNFYNIDKWILCKRINMYFRRNRTMD